MFHHIPSSSQFPEDRKAFEGNDTWLKTLAFTLEDKLLLVSAPGNVFSCPRQNELLKETFVKHYDRACYSFTIFAFRQRVSPGVVHWEIFFYVM